MCLRRSQATAAGTYSVDQINRGQGAMPVNVVRYHHHVNEKPVEPLHLYLAHANHAFRI